MVKKPCLKLVDKAPSTVTPPPRKLGVAGMNLWRSVLAQIEDAGGIELLCLACQALDRAEELRELIDTDGAVVRTKAGPKAHPALRDELNCRAFVSRALARLGLDVEPVGRVGRPGGYGFA